MIFTFENRIWQTGLGMMVVLKNWNWQPCLCRRIKVVVEPAASVSVNEVWILQRIRPICRMLLLLLLLLLFRFFLPFFRRGPFLFREHFVEDYGKPEIKVETIKCDLRPISPTCLQKAFMHEDPKSAKRHSSCQCLFVLLGSTCIKGAP